MSEIRIEREQLPSRRNSKKNNHYITVWEYAGKILEKHNLERNGELQYSLFKWLRQNNTKETGGLCEDGFFDDGATVIFPGTSKDVLLACATLLKLNENKVMNSAFSNDIAIIGNDASRDSSVKAANIQSFYEAAMRAGYETGRQYDRIPYSGKWRNFSFVTRSGKEAINLLRKNGTKTNPITGIFFSTHGVPYAIDFNNTGNNLYISEKEIKGLYERTFTNKKWRRGKKSAYIADFVTLASEGIITEDVTITLCGCLNGCSKTCVLSNAEPLSKQWQTEKNAKNIAQCLSEALPKAVIIANRTQVDSGQGLNNPVMYKNGKKQ